MPLLKSCLVVVFFFIKSFIFSLIEAAVAFLVAAAIAGFFAWLLGYDSRYVAISGGCGIGLMVFAAMFLVRALGFWDRLQQGLTAQRIRKINEEP